MKRELFFSSLASFLKCIFLVLVGCQSTKNTISNSEIAGGTEQSQVSKTEASRDPAVTALKASEKTLTFEAILEYKPQKNEEIPKKELTHKKIPKRILDTITTQVSHMYGPMELAAKRTDKKDRKAVPSENFDITFLGYENHKSKSNYVVIKFRYQGTILVEDGPSKSYLFPLPADPDQIFKLAKRGKTTHCVDPHYQTEDDFWYFWSPKEIYPDCHLKEGEDYHWIEGRLTAAGTKSKKKTYPEYSRLVHSKAVDIHLIFGKDSPRSGNNPRTSKDDNAKNFLKVEEALKNARFEVTKEWTPEQIKTIARGKDIKKEMPATVPYVQDMQYKSQSGVVINLRMFYGQTELFAKNNAAFHYFFRDALDNAAILIYDGHSGLGAHLDFENIKEARGNRFQIGMNRDRYQIVFLNSCSSYSYFNASYLKAKTTQSDKKGTKNLDLLLNGLSTDYDPKSDTSLIFAVQRYLDSNKATSYIDLAKEMDTGNLFVVIGDEDNQRP